MLNITWGDFSTDESWEYIGYLNEKPIAHAHKSKSEKGYLDIFVRYEFYKFEYSYKPRTFDIKEALVEVEEILNKHVEELKRQVALFGI